MVITIKNPTLKKKVFAKLNRYDSQAIKYYEQGNMAKGKALEKKSDRLYATNYNKMFKISKRVK